MKRMIISTVLGTLLVFLIFSSLSAAESQRIRIAYDDSKESIAKSYMFKYIIENMVGLKVDLYKVSVKETWKGLAEGRYDASMSVVLPQQKTYYARYGNRVVDLGPNFMDAKRKVLTVTRLGLLDTRPRLAKFLRHYCLCASKLDSVVALVKSGEISKQDADKWIKENEKWLRNMLGLCEDIRIEDWG